MLACSASAPSQPASPLLCRCVIIVVAQQGVIIQDGRQEGVVTPGPGAAAGAARGRGAQRGQRVGAVCHLAADEVDQADGAVVVQAQLGWVAGAEGLGRQRCGGR